jgi:hypothetical protein
MKPRSKKAEITFDAKNCRSAWNVSVFSRSMFAPWQNQHFEILSRAAHQ